MIADLTCVRDLSPVRIYIIYMIVFFKILVDVYWQTIVILTDFK